MTASTQVLKCKPREIKNTGYLKELKRNEWVPAVIYGKGQANFNVLLARKELSRIFTHMGTRGIFSLEVEGEKQTQTLMAQVKEIQKNRISGAITHVDFLAIKMDQKINSMLRIHLVGEEAIIDKGGALQVILREIPVTCLPGDLPEMVNFDISGMEIGSKVVVGDLPLPTTVEVAEEADAVVANILASTVESDDDEAEIEKNEEAGD